MKMRENNNFHWKKKNSVINYNYHFFFSGQSKIFLFIFIQDETNFHQQFVNIYLIVIFWRYANYFIILLMFV